MSDQPDSFLAMDAQVDSYFAAAGRAQPLDLAALAREAAHNPIFQAVLDSTEGFVMVLDEHRQVLAANQELLKALGLDSEGAVLGLRPGEALACTHVAEGPSGCGTSRACSQCGAVLAILACQADQHSVDNECFLTLRRGQHLEAIEFRVKATPLPLGDHSLTVLVLVDISAEKRRDVLESLFHHDVNNTLQGLWALGELFQISTIDPKEAGKKILDISLRLKQELDYQRILLAAEAGTFEVKFEVLPVHDLLSNLANLFAPRQLAKQRRLLVTALPQDGSVRSDRELLLRVLENMVTNALEATPPGAAVEVWFSREDGRASFHVRNLGVLPEAVALRIFQRSFSTKSSKGRGLGTYGMKLFGETYLGGSVSFTSAKREGTTFTLALPIEA